MMVIGIVVFFVKVQPGAWLPTCLRNLMPPS